MSKNFAFHKKNMVPRITLGNSVKRISYEIDLVFDFTKFLPCLFKISYPHWYIPRGELYYKHT